MQKKDLSKLVLTTLLTGSVLWGGTAFAAEENLQEFSLDTMVVTATRTEMSVKEAPSAVQVVDSKKLEQTQAKTLHDALRVLWALMYSTISRDAAMSASAAVNPVTY